MQLLYDTFSAFGVIIATPKIMRDPETGNSKGFGFVSYDCFEASDSAIEAMNHQYLCGRQITVSYAYKKDTKGGGLGFRFKLGFRFRGKWGRSSGGDKGTEVGGVRG